MVTIISNHHHNPSIIFLLFKKFLLIDLREKDINSLFRLLLHSLLDSCMYPDGEIEPTSLSYGDHALTYWATHSEQMFFYL